MNEICLRAYAKINPGLDVRFRREDGYHEVKMILQSVDIFDEIRIQKVCNEEQKITLSLNEKSLPADDKNLIVKAAALLKKEYGIRESLHIDLMKRIPMAAGMAGGSADAAATLVGLNFLFDLGLSCEKLQEIGLQIGADVPFCIQGGTVLAEGIGEKLTTLHDFPKAYVVVIKPKQGISTKYVYENLNVADIRNHPDIDIVADCIRKEDLQGIGRNISNILENVTVKKMPIIEEIKKKMLTFKALGSSMSGSGPSVFGLFDTKESAVECIRYFQENIEKYDLSDVFLTKTFDKGVMVISSKP